MSDSEIQFGATLFGAILALGGGMIVAHLQARSRRNKLGSSLYSEVEVAAELLEIDLDQNLDAFEATFGEHTDHQTLLVKRVKNSRKIFDACCNEIVDLPCHQSIIRHYGRLDAICDAMFDALKQDDQGKFEELRSELALSAECLKMDLKAYL